MPDGPTSLDQVISRWSCHDWRTRAARKCQTGPDPAGRQKSGERRKREATALRSSPSLLDYRFDRDCRHTIELLCIAQVFHVKLDRTERADLHEQVAAEIRRAIAEGEAKPGDRLPPVGDFAAVLGVNRNTVLRAFRDLRDEGLLELRRGRGVTVIGSPQQGVVHSGAVELLELARRHGYRREELVELIESLP